MKAAIIFDMDGVILDSEPIHYQVERNILKGYEVDFEFSEHTTFVGQTTLDLWQALCSKYHLPVKPELLAKMDNHDYIHQLKHGDAQPIEGVLDLINQLHQQGFDMAVASSAIHENINIVLDKFDIRKYFVGHVSGQDVPKTKPNPDIFYKAAELLDQPPSNCIVIEDAKHGVHAAKAAGMACVAFRNLNSGNQDLSDADVVIQDMAQLNRELIDSLTQHNKINS